ncbi:hypothetical protein [uncultured Campylobacter sp.]|uniref:hypothetical protein n=1 Tax=uncultured Campylobacter sp. TaxID=218934 RepID=UPI00261FDAE6|nr:hypothetical protein [uncultured Campylobacter sp.]
MLSLSAQACRLLRWEFDSAKFNSGFGARTLNLTASFIRRRKAEIHIGCNAAQARDAVMPLARAKF